jgi:hypothetical protein
MSHIRCICGNDIADNRENNRYKADLIADEDSKIWTHLAESLAGFMKAVSAGGRLSWLKETFSSGYPKNLTDLEVIYDTISGVTTECSRTVYECDKCGRLWVQADREMKEFKSFVPESGGYQGVLRKR